LYDKEVFGEDLYLTGLRPSFPVLIEIKLPLRKRFSTPAGVGTYVIGATESDLPDIGKNLVSMMLQGAGFKVVDLGTTSPPRIL
jgi:methanogenic corrinoid protein MtbC1